VDAHNDPGPGLQRHLQACRACRRFYEQELSVSQGLTHSALKERVSPSPFLQARIISAVERSAPQTHIRPLVGRLAWTVASVAVCLLLVRAVHGPFAPRPVVSKADLSGVIKELTMLEKRMPDQQKLQQWSGTVDEPLDKEMRSLFNDARNVAQTLVQNFLPDNLARSSNRDPNGD
jgi:hypothetical protein